MTDSRPCSRIRKKRNRSLWRRRSSRSMYNELWKTQGALRENATDGGGCRPPEEHESWQPRKVATFHGERLCAGRQGDETWPTSQVCQNTQTGPQHIVNDDRDHQDILQSIAPRETRDVHVARMSFHINEQLVTAGQRPKSGEVRHVKNQVESWTMIGISRRSRQRPLALNKLPWCNGKIWMVSIAMGGRYLNPWMMTKFCPREIRGFRSFAAMKSDVKQ